MFSEPHLHRITPDDFAFTMKQAFPDMLMRPATSADLPALRSIYADSVRTLATSCYSPAQLQVWAAFARDAAFQNFILATPTWIAADTETAVPLGFCGVMEDGHITSIYVAPEHGRRGIGSALLEHALGRCPRPSSGRWYAEASHLSRSLFERFGFKSIGVDRAERQGVVFERDRVERHARGSGP